MSPLLSQLLCISFSSFRFIHCTECSRRQRSSAYPCQLRLSPEWNQNLFWNYLHKNKKQFANIHYAAQNSVFFFNSQCNDVALVLAGVPSSEAGTGDASSRSLPRSSCSSSLWPLLDLVYGVVGLHTPTKSNKQMSNDFTETHLRLILQEKGLILITHPFLVFFFLLSCGGGVGEGDGERFLFLALLGFLSRRSSGVVTSSVRVLAEILFLLGQPSPTS